jgi:hypothetical protein
MKSFYIRSIAIIATVIAITNTGCLKDKEFIKGDTQSTDGPEAKVVEIKLTATNASNFFTLVVNNSNNDTTVDLVPINLATANPAPEDLHVTVDLYPSLVDNYNNDNGTGYATPPDNILTIVNPVVIIPKGSHTGYVQIKFKPSNFIGGDWALGFKITAIQETGYLISTNFSTGITAILVKNDYDGEYSVTGTLNDVTGGSTGIYPFEADLISTGLTSNALYNINPAQLSGFYHVASFGGSPNVYGGFAPVFTIDPVTGNVTDVTDFYPLDDPSNIHARTAKLDPAGINKYDFSTKTMKVSYILHQGDLGIDRVFFNETFTYVGPR